jgi:hypothetical protein
LEAPNDIETMRLFRSEIRDICRKNPSVGAPLIRIPLMLDLISPGSWGISGSKQDAMRTLRVGEQTGCKFLARGIKA